VLGEAVHDLLQVGGERGSPLAGAVGSGANPAVTVGPLGDGEQVPGLGAALDAFAHHRQGAAGGFRIPARPGAAGRGRHRSNRTAFNCLRKDKKGRIVMARKAGLGRGLEALIPTGETSQPSNGILLVARDKVLPNPRQPRTDIASEELNELADSIREHGILMPLVVTPDRKMISTS